MQIPTQSLQKSNSIKSVNATTQFYGITAIFVISLKENGRQITEETQSVWD